MLEEYEILKDMEEFEKRLFERQTELVHIHEAGHMIAARYCRLKIVSAGPGRARQRGERMTRAETELIRRFTAEHAWRLILAPDRENQVEELRSRTVDRDIFDSEREQWSNWHRQQTQAEREFEK